MCNPRGAGVRSFPLVPQSVDISHICITCRCHLTVGLSVTTPGHRARAHSNFQQEGAYGLCLATDEPFFLLYVLTCAYTLWQAVFSSGRPTDI